MKASINKNRFRNFNIGFIFICSFVLWAFNIKKDYQPTIIVELPIEEIYNPILPPFALFKKPEQKPPEKAKKTEAYRANAPIKKVSDLIKIEHKSIAPLKRSFFKKRSHTAAPKPININHNKIEIVVDVKSSFPGGPDALMKFLRANLIYPLDCVDDGMEGKVVIQFVVDEFGNISQLSILKNELLFSAGKESARVIKMMPKWAPGIKNGRAVKSYFVQTIRFKIR